MPSNLCCNTTQPRQVSTTAGMHAGGPSDVIVLEYSKGKLSICYKHHLKSIYLHREEQVLLNISTNFVNMHVPDRLLILL